ncbi:MAG TPA: pseudouridine-5'-phosphate glycosidase [Chloroflexota bacterium]
MTLLVAPEVREALSGACPGPVVALETSIVAQGLPRPHNLRAALGCEEAIRAAGAVPATIAVLDGAVRVGLTHAEIEALAAADDAAKVSAKDLGWAIAKRRAGATTVAATARAAALAGVRFMATGGIGGVHRGHPEDVSADLDELARSPVAVFCAGAKMILDLALTLERLETLGVPVLGYGCDELPGFYLRRSGLPVDARIDGPREAAAVLRASWATGTRGVVVAVPPPGDLPGAAEAVEQAIARQGSVAGKNVTPFLLAHVAELSGGRSLDFNVDLVVNNARAAAETSVQYSALGP